jgi:hypothetical protein
MTMADTAVPLLLKLSRTGDVKILTELPVFKDWHIFCPDRIDVQGVPVDICIYKTGGHKCPRCWKYTAKAKDGICERCTGVLMKLPEEESSASEQKMPGAENSRVNWEAAKTL